MDELTAWVGANVSEGYRAAVLAVADTLEDLAPSGNCPICYEKLSRDATVFECSHAMCASCSDSYAKSEVERSMSRRSGVSVACPLCRAPSKVVLPEEMHASLPLGPTKRRRRSTDE